MAKILIVDDQPSILNLLRAILEKNGHSVSEATDGHAALERVRAVSPDLIITDIFMPEMDGLEFLRRVKDVPHRSRILAMSGGGVMDHGQVLGMARALGADAVMTKPFVPHELLVQVSQLLQEEPSSP